MSAREDGENVGKRRLKDATGPPWIVILSEPPRLELAAPSGSSPFALFLLRGLSSFFFPFSLPDPLIQPPLPLGSDLSSSSTSSFSARTLIDPLFKADLAPCSVLSHL